MQTFLPLPDFSESAACLDMRRLGKQRVEALSILRIMKNIGSPQEMRWKNHPAVQMWYFYRGAIEQYMRAMILEWIKRGYKNTIPIPEPERFIHPPWLGWEKLHASHRAALLAKKPEWYGQFGWSESPKIAYIWPK